MPEDTFADILRRRSPELNKCLEDMRRRAEDEWVHLLKPDHGSHSGLIHLRNVERNADKIVSPELKEHFSNGEIFLLLASVLLHDLGRIIPDRPRREIVVRWPEAGQAERFRQAKGRSNSETAKLAESLQGLYTGQFTKTEFEVPGKFLPEGLEYRLVEHSEQSREICPLTGKPCTDRERSWKDQKTHACRTRFLIREYWPNFCLPDEQIAALCGVVTFCHQLDAPPAQDSGCTPVQECAREFANTSLEPYGSIRVPLLAAILRVADETEDSWTRAIRQHWYEQYLKVSPGDMYKAFRRGVADVEFRPEARCIIMHLHDATPAEGASRKRLVDSLNDKVDDTRKALRRWRAPLEQAGIRYEHVFVQQGGRLYLHPPHRQQEGVPTLEIAVKELQNALESELFDDRGVLQQAYLPSGTVQRYLRQIGKMVLGTWEFDHFRWSGVEGAIGEPLDDRKKWTILRIGGASPDLRIAPHESGDELEIRLTKDGLAELKKYLGAEKPAGSNHDG